VRLFHRENAGRPPRVRWALEEVGAPYDWVVLTSEEVNSAEHRERHPLGRVPVLEDHEGSLYESAALCLHIADEHPEARLIAPLGSRERALIYQWTLFAMTELEPPMVEAARERFGTAIGAVEDALAHSDYLVGNRFTVADIIVGAILRSAVRRELLTPSERLAGYLERLTSRRAYARAYQEHPPR
jgi:glutathione S-transferase